MGWTQYSAILVPYLTALRCARMMEHATDMLNDLTNPRIGITNVASAISRMESDMPRSSFPSTTAVGTDQSISLIGTADGERSLATTLKFAQCKWDAFIMKTSLQVCMCHLSQTWPVSNHSGQVQQGERNFVRQHMLIILRQPMQARSSYRPLHKGRQVPDSGRRNTVISWGVP